MIGILLLATLLVQTNDSSIAARIDAYSSKLPHCLSRFSDYPPGPGALGFPRCLFEKPFPLNPDFWFKDIDFTCASPWNDSFGCQRAGTAISKRHIIFAKHFPLTIGTRIAFVGESGDVSHYTVKATKAVEKCDIMLGLLDYELTPDVHPAKILPRDYGEWMAEGSKWPVVTFNQREEAYLSEVTRVIRGPERKPGIDNRMASSLKWRPLGGRFIGGDSGNPAFMIFKGHSILLYCLYNGGIGHGPMIHEFRREVQQAMDDLCPGYSLEKFDFASSSR